MGTTSGGAMQKTTLYACLLLLVLSGKELLSPLLRHAHASRISDNHMQQKGVSTTVRLALIACCYFLSPLPCSQVSTWFRHRPHKVRNCTIVIVPSRFMIGFLCCAVRKASARARIYGSRAATPHVSHVTV